MYRFRSKEEAWREHTQISTAHGYRRFGWSVHIWAKIFWLFLFVLGFVTFFVLMVYVILDFRAFEAKTVVKTESDTYPEFPSVTVCNLNPVRNSRLSTTQRSTLNAATNVATKVASQVIKERVATIASSSNGHLRDDMIMYCTYEGKICHNAPNFVLYQSPKYGSCFTFNSQKDKRIAGHQGPLYGLVMVVNNERPEHVGGIGESDGFRVSIHSPGSQPHPHIHGLSFATGKEITIGIKQSERRRLGSPYGNCEDHDEDGFYKTTLSCAGSSCGSRDSDCSCHPPCKEKEYDMEVSETEWPSESHRRTVEDMLRTRHPRHYNASLRFQDLSLLKIYFRDFTKTVIDQTPAYTFSRLLTQIGGLTALCVGMSVLTLFEAIDIVASLIVSPSGCETDRRPLEEYPGYDSASSAPTAEYPSTPSQAPTPQPPPPPPQPDSTSAVEELTGAS